MCHMSSALMLQVTTSVYIVCEQLRCHQPLVYMLARSKHFPVHVVCLLFRVTSFLKLKLSCTVETLVHVNTMLFAFACRNLDLVISLKF